MAPQDRIAPWALGRGVDGPPLLRWKVSKARRLTVLIGSLLEGRGGLSPNPQPWRMPGWTSSLGPSLPAPPPSFAAVECAVAIQDALYETHEVLCQLKVFF